MIIDFGIQNFESIKEKQTLSLVANPKNDHLEKYYTFEVEGLRLLKMIMIYGANASGKTTVLKALEFLRDLVISPVETKNDELDFSPFLFDAQTPKENTRFEINFIQQKKQYNYCVVFNQRYIVEETLKQGKVGKKGKLVATRTTDAEKQLTQISFEKAYAILPTSKQLLEGNTLWNTSMFAGFLKTTADIDVFKDVTDWFTHYLMPMISPKTRLKDYTTKMIDRKVISKRIFLKLLQQADFYISDIKIGKKEEDIPEGFLKMFLANDDFPEEAKKELKSKKKMASIEVKLEHDVNGQPYTLPFKKESQGTERYYGLAGILILLLKKNGIVCIDELESSLHPDLFQHFILTYLCNSNYSQCIVTTHNREILNDKDLFRKDTIWMTEKDDNCATTLYSLEEFDSSVIRNTTNILNVYKAGRLGGVPNLGDYYIDLEEDEDE